MPHPVAQCLVSDSYQLYPKKGAVAAVSPYTVAIIADAHFHDPKACFGGAGIVANGERLALRSWKDIRTGARAINETALALMTALDRIAAVGIRHVIFAGDYTDDGQVENTRSLASVLERYHEAHGMRFYVIPGNHDTFGSVGKHVSTRFVTGPDTSVLVTSDPKLAATEGHDAVLTEAMRCEGQPAALRHMARFGLFRRHEDLHWESPFGPSDAPEARQYDAIAADGSVVHRLMDASYLVEPEAGLWLLMIDANVFEPRSGQTDASRKKTFLDPADAGWKAVLRVKPFLLPWIRDVVSRAAAAGKTLVTVSHYPVLDPFQDSAGSEAALFGATSIVRRTPKVSVGKALIAAGLHWHAGGHMHVNATTIMQTNDGQLADLSLPSLAAFPPAFKILQATPSSVAVETVVLQDLPANPTIQTVYQMQGRVGPPLEYDAFLLSQFRSHVIEQILPRDWPPDLLSAIGVADTAMLLNLLNAPLVQFSAEYGISMTALSLYPALEMIADAYLIRAAGPLAHGYVKPASIRICNAFAVAFGDEAASPEVSHAAFIRRFLSVLRVSLGRMGTSDGIVWEQTNLQNDI
jgi:3',5'-cyclic AMP phosphodiesterase CpdA